MDASHHKMVMIIGAIAVIAVLVLAFAGMRNYKPMVNLQTATPTSTPVATPDLGNDVGSQVKDPTSDIPKTNPFATKAPNPFSNTYENPFK